MSVFFKYILFHLLVFLTAVALTTKNNWAWAKLKRRNTYLNFGLRVESYIIDDLNTITGLNIHLYSHPDKKMENHRHFPSQGGFYIEVSHNWWYMKLYHWRQDMSKPYLNLELDPIKECLMKKLIFVWLTYKLNDTISFISCSKKVIV